MATVKMKRGSLFADIYNSPETIAQAKKEGYELVNSETKDTKSDKETIETKKSASSKKKD